MIVSVCLIVLLYMSILSLFLVLLHLCSCVVINIWVCISKCMRFFVLNFVDKQFLSGCMFFLCLCVFVYVILVRKHMSLSLCMCVCIQECDCVKYLMYICLCEEVSFTYDVFV